MKVKAIQERDNISINIKGAYGLTLNTFERNTALSKPVTFKKMELQDLDLQPFSLELKEYDILASRWGLFYPLIKVVIDDKAAGFLRKVVNNTNQGLLSIAYCAKIENKGCKKFTIKTELPNAEDYINMYNPDKLEKEKFLTLKDVVNHLMNKLNEKL